MKVEIGEILSDDDQIVLERIREYGKAWIVGGWVRDFISGKGTRGYLDIATTLEPHQVKEIFPRTILVGEKYGTVIVRLDGDSHQGFWEVTTLRSDGGYGDGRRPDNVSFGEDIMVDLSRRDFTINAMAIDEKGNVIDIDGKGLEDLSSGILRTVGDSAERISEDGLRIMRAFRFLDGSEAGVRELDSGLSSAINSNVHMLERVSKERIWAELRMILSGDNIREILESMVGHGILDSILPGIKHNYNLKFSKNPRVNLALICSNEEVAGSELTDSLRKYLKISNDDYSGLGKDAHEMEDAISSLPPNSIGNSPLVDGILLSEVTGLEPGRRLGRLKGWLHRRQIEDDLTSTEQVLQMLDEIEWKDSDPESWKNLSWP